MIVNYAGEEIKDEIREENKREKPKVVTTKAQKVKRNPGAEMLKNDISEALKDVWGSTVLPGIKDFAIVTLQRILFPDGSGSYVSRNNTRRNNYRVVSTNTRRGNDNVREPRRRTLEYEMAEFDTYLEASNVLDQMWEYIETYNYVTLAEYYTMAGFDAAPYSYAKWGWDDLSGVRPTKTFNGKYVLNLPNVISLR